MSGSHLCPLSMNVRANRHPSCTRGRPIFVVVVQCTNHRASPTTNANLRDSESLRGYALRVGVFAATSVKRTSLCFSLHAFRAENHTGLRLRSHPGWSFEHGPRSAEKRNSSEDRS